MDQNENRGNRQATTIFNMVANLRHTLCTRFPNLELHQERVCPSSPVPKTTLGSNDQKPDKGSASPSRLDISESPSDSVLIISSVLHTASSSESLSHNCLYNIESPWDFFSSTTYKDGPSSNTSMHTKNDAGLLEFLEVLQFFNTLSFLGPLWTLNPISVTAFSILSNKSLGECVDVNRIFL